MVKAPPVLEGHHSPGGQEQAGDDPRRRSRLPPTPAHSRRPHDTGQGEQAEQGGVARHRQPPCGERVPQHGAVVDPVGRPRGAVGLPKHLVDHQLAETVVEVDRGAQEAGGLGHRGCPVARLRWPRVCPVVAGQADPQADVTEPDLVVRGELGRGVQPPPVDDGAVRRPEVREPQRSPVPVHDGMLAADARRVDDDVPRAADTPLAPTHPYRPSPHRDGRGHLEHRGVELPHLRWLRVSPRPRHDRPFPRDHPEPQRTEASGATSRLADISRADITQTTYKPPPSPAGLRGPYSRLARARDSTVMVIEPPSDSSRSPTTGTSARPVSRTTAVWPSGLPVPGATVHSIMLGGRGRSAR